MRVHRIPLAVELHDIYFWVRQFWRIVLFSSERQPLIFGRPACFRPNGRLVIQTVRLDARNLDIGWTPTYGRRLDTLDRAIMGRMRGSDLMPGREAF